MTGLATRALILAVMTLGVHEAIAGRAPQPARAQSPLAAFPLRVDRWSGADAGALDAETLRVLGADEYLNRIYTDDDGRQVGLYVAFYEYQRQGDSIHSPLNCLPGNGWLPVSHRYSSIVSRGRTVPVNQYVVEKRGARELVLYWFEGRGRVIASEYWNKLYLLVDAFRLRRTDGALVRVMAPLGAAAPSTASAGEFAQAVEPLLAQWLP
jgi:EpsI family protein